MKNKILLFSSDEILEEWKKDSYVMIDRDNSVKSESLRIHNEHHKYLKYLKDIKRGKYLLEEAYAKLFKNKTLYYEYDSVFTKEQLDGFGWKYDPFDGRTRPKTKERLKMYFDSDEDYYYDDDDDSSYSAAEVLDIGFVEDQMMKRLMLKLKLLVQKAVRGR